MARLTKKYDDGTYGIERCTCEHEQKLGLLEDILEKHGIDVDQLDSILTEYAKHKKIENALGIDFVTLVSALSSPYIYGITSDDDHEKPYIFGFDTRDVQLNAEEKTLDVYWQGSDEIYTQYKLSDYGKTWSLDKNDLTKE